MPNEKHRNRIKSNLTYSSRTTRMTVVLPGTRKPIVYTWKQCTWPTVHNMYWFINYHDRLSAFIAFHNTYWKIWFVKLTIIIWQVFIIFLRAHHTPVYSVIWTLMYEESRLLKRFFSVIIVVNNNYTIYLVYAANKSDRCNYGRHI